MITGAAGSGITLPCCTATLAYNGQVHARMHAAAVDTHLHIVGSPRACGTQQCNRGACTGWEAHVHCKTSKRSSCTPCRSRRPGFRSQPGSAR